VPRTLLSAARARSLELAPATRTDAHASAERRRAELLYARWTRTGVLLCAGSAWRRRYSKAALTAIY